MKTLLTKQSLLAGFGVLVIIVSGYLLVDMSLGTKEEVLVGATPGMPMSLNELLLSTVTQRCTFVTPSDAGTSKGEFFIAHGSMRGDFETEMTQANTGGAITSHMIIANGYAYVWSDTAPMGAKISIEAMKSAEEKGAAEGRPVGMNQKVAYSCAPWKSDESYFAVPTKISFMDMSSMSKGAVPTAGTAGMQPPSGMGGSAGVELNNAQMKALQCKACEQAGEGAAECRKALSCVP